MRRRYGGVKVSTGILTYGKRVETPDLFKIGNLKLNANNTELAAA